MLDLTELFQTLSPPCVVPPSGARFSAASIPGYERHRLGRDTAGAPALLLTVSHGAGERRPPPIELEHLSIQHEIRCQITYPDTTERKERYSLVHCTSEDPALRSYFLRICGAVVEFLGETPSYPDVAQAFSQLVELFRAIVAPPRKSVQGLWAELLFMARLRNPAPLVAAWHVLPSDRYDFSGGSQRIEVKSAAGRVRRHHFMLEQLLPVPGTQVLIASFLVERAGAGTSLLDLVTQVRSRVSHEPRLLLHVDKIVTQTLGNTWRSAQDDRFDRQLAESSLTFFDPVLIPKVSPDLPVAVSDVRFRVDLTSVAPIDLRQYRTEDGLFGTCARQ